MPAAPRFGQFGEAAPAAAAKHTRPMESKYVWLRSVSTERCVPFVPTYSTVPTMLPGNCRSTPRFHWSTSGCTACGSTPRIRTVCRKLAGWLAGSSEKLKPVRTRMLFAVHVAALPTQLACPTAAAIDLSMIHGGFRNIWSSEPARSNSW